MSRSLVIHRTTAALLALVASAPLVSADLITGRVVDANGVGVPGVNIDAIRVSNGNDENLANDGTDANGFFSTTIPGNVYDLHFIPPAPPATSHVPLVLRNVVVSGTKALGTLTLQMGVVLSGTCRSEAGLPIANVTVTVTDTTTGFVIPQSQLRTNAFGSFAVAVPQSPIGLALLPRDALPPYYAPQSLALVPSGNTNLGTLTLEDAFRVTGHVQRASNGAALVNVDLDFTDASTGVKLFLTNDNTDALGNFAIVVPAASYEVELCAPLASRVVSKLVLADVPAQLDLGTIAMDPGFLLSGVFRTAGGLPHAGGDLDVRMPGVGKIVTCNDNSNASGNYAVVVPSGSLKLLFHPASYTLGLGSGVANVSIAGDTVLDGVLPNCAATIGYGTGLAGTGGLVPQLTTSGGVPAIDNVNFGIELQNGRGGATAWLLIGFGPAAIPSLGGTLLVSPNNAIPIVLPLGGTPGVAGVGSRHLPAQPLRALIGIEVFAQFFVQDPLATQGWAFSNGIRFRVCR